MKLLQYIIFIIKIENVELYFIKNQNKPICANCKYFISTNNECSKFGEINIIHNIKKYNIIYYIHNAYFFKFYAFICSKNPIYW